MQLALEEAGQAAVRGEVPIGAVIVSDETLVARAHNLVETNQDPTAHAEMVAIRIAADVLQVKWLSNCTIYVTLEPCPMCAGAIILARFDRLVFGAPDPKNGACGSLENLVQDPRRNHQTAVRSGVLIEPSRRMLQEFFRKKRSERCQSG